MYIWVFPKIVGFPPKSSILNKVFHYFHHAFWGTPIFGNTHIYIGIKIHIVREMYIDLYIYTIYTVCEYVNDICIYQYIDGYIACCLMLSV